jgi:hypothetical protein
MRSVTQTGVGGTTITLYLPVILFDDGWARLSPSADAIEDPVGDRAREPKPWVQWRRASDNNSEFEKLENGTWKTIGRSREYTPLPRGHALDRTYYTISGGGNSSSGGDLTIVNSAYLQFSTDGKFALSSSYQNISSIPVSSSSRQSGTYVIDGYVLSLKLGDGTTERALIVSSNDESLWLDNTFYCSASPDGGCE